MKLFYVWALMRASFVLIVILIFARKALFRKRQKCAKGNHRFLCVHACHEWKGIYKLLFS